MTCRLRLLTTAKRQGPKRIKLSFTVYNDAFKPLPTARFHFERNVSVLHAVLSLFQKYVWQRLEKWAERFHWHFFQFHISKGQKSIVQSHTVLVEDGSHVLEIPIINRDFTVHCSWRGKCKFTNKKTEFMNTMCMFTKAHIASREPWRMFHELWKDSNQISVIFVFAKRGEQVSLHTCNAARLWRFHTHYCCSPLFWPFPFNTSLNNTNLFSDSNIYCKLILNTQKLLAWYRNNRLQKAFCCYLHWHCVFPGGDKGLVHGVWPWHYAEGQHFLLSISHCKSHTDKPLHCEPSLIRTLRAPRQTPADNTLLIWLSDLNCKWNQTLPITIGTCH